MHYFLRFSSLFGTSVYYKSYFIIFPLDLSLYLVILFYFISFISYVFLLIGPYVYDSRSVGKGLGSIKEVEGNFRGSVTVIPIPP